MNTHHLKGRLFGPSFFPSLFLRHPSPPTKSLPVSEFLCYYFMEMLVLFNIKNKNRTQASAELFMDSDFT